MGVIINQIAADSLSSVNLNNSLVTSKSFIRSFGLPEDIVQYHIYTPAGDRIISNYNFKGYSFPDKIQQGSLLVDHLILSPDNDIKSNGFDFGKYVIQYNFLRRKIINTPTRSFFIKEISSNRLEVRISTTVVSTQVLEQNTLVFINEFENSSYYKEFLLDFGQNIFATAVNIALDKNSDPSTILVKLYQPLAGTINVNDLLWIEEGLSDAYTYEVDMFPDPQVELPLKIRSANFDVNIEEHIIKPSSYFNIASLFSNTSVAAYQNLLNKLHNQRVEINVDYSDFSNFVHFSSAFERLENFKYKMQLLEGYQTNINSVQLIPTYSINASSSIYTYQQTINDLIQGFDGYERYLYFESTSYSWPKITSVKPYVNASSTSSVALSWYGSYDTNSSVYGGMAFSSSIFDQENLNNLIYTVPGFIRNNPDNASYLLFLNMVGHHFDNIWIYFKSITDLHKANNSITHGISKDMVYHALRSLGIKVANNESNANIFDYLIGSNSSGSFSSISSSLFTTVSASNQTLPGEIRYKELLKRIYHNLPYLLKSKGTARGIKALMSTFGIPSTLIDVLEYGGSDKSNTTFEYNYDRFSYALNTPISGNAVYNIYCPWVPLTLNAFNSGVFNIVADTIEFRFKPDKNYVYQLHTSQQLLEKINTSSFVNTINPNSVSAYFPEFGIFLDYTSSNGMPYGNIYFALSGSSGYITSSNITLPIFITSSTGDMQWWNVMIKRRFPNRRPNQENLDQFYDLYVKNKIGNQIGHQGSASLFVTGATPQYNFAWDNFTSCSNLYLGGVGQASSLPDEFGSGHYNFSGSFQELRLWATSLSENAFNFHVLNPESIQGNDSGSTWSTLAARFPLGNNLLTYDHTSVTSVQSVHPQSNTPFSSGSWAGGTIYGYGLYGIDVYGNSGSNNPFTSFVNSLFFTASLFATFSYTSFVETYHGNVPNSLYSNPVTDKIRISTKTVTGSVLRHDVRLEDDPIIPLTKDLHFVDISLSPQNEINKDIIAHYGDNFNIDNLIGDPTEDAANSYANLRILREEYYAKYLKKYNYADFIRLIGFFNNTLFKMIEDNIPARSNLQTGITIKPTLIERSKVKIRRPVVENNTYTASFTTYSFVADSSYVNPVGDNRDFFNGELSGSIYNIHKYFQSGNKNPYKLFTETIDFDLFAHSNYHVLLNNVSSSRLSEKINTIDWGNPAVQYPSELQDSYRTSRRHTNPRYRGSKSRSLKYNVYTSASFTKVQLNLIGIPTYSLVQNYDGDRSYDQTAAIDIYSNKFAFFSEVVMTGSTLPSRSNAYIKYLIDETGSVVELTRQNKNLPEIQNIFKSWEQVDVSLFDNQNPSVQNVLDGIKPVFAGGYRYSAILYNDGQNPTGSLLFDTSQQFQQAQVGFSGFTSHPPQIVTITFATPVGLQANYLFLTRSTYDYNYDGTAYMETNIYTAPRDGNYDIEYSVFAQIPPNVVDDGFCNLRTALQVNGVVFTRTGTISNVPNYRGDLYLSTVLTGIPLLTGQQVKAQFFVDGGSLGPRSVIFGISNDPVKRFQVQLPTSNNFTIGNRNVITYTTVTTQTINTSSLWIVDPNARNYISGNTFLSTNYGVMSFKGYTPNTYEQVEYPFYIQPGDLIRFATGSNISNELEFEIAEVIPSGAIGNPNLILRTSTYIPTNANPDYFVLVKKIPDETNIVLRFPKRIGQTSSGLIIPGNIDPEIRKNIANIVSPLKESLLAKVLIVGH